MQEGATVLAPIGTFGTANAIYLEITPTRPFTRTLWVNVAPTMDARRRNVMACH